MDIHIQESVTIISIYFGMTSLISNGINLRAFGYLSYLSSLGNSNYRYITNQISVPNIILSCFGFNERKKRTINIKPIDGHQTKVTSIGSLYDILCHSGAEMPLLWHCLPVVSYKYSFYVFGRCVLLQLEISVGFCNGVFMSN